MTAFRAKIIKIMFSFLSYHQISTFAFLSVILTAIFVRKMPAFDKERERAKIREREKEKARERDRAQEKERDRQSHNVRNQRIFKGSHSDVFFLSEFFKYFSPRILLIKYSKIGNVIILNALFLLSQVFGGPLMVLLKYSFCFVR